MSRSLGKNKCLGVAGLRRWNMKLGKLRANWSLTEQPLPEPLSFRPFWVLPLSSHCSSTSACCRGMFPLEEVRERTWTHMGSVAAGMALRI